MSGVGLFDTVQITPNWNNRHRPSRLPTWAKGRVVKASEKNVWVQLNHDDEYARHKRMEGHVIMVSRVRVTPCTEEKVGSPW